MDLLNNISAEINEIELDRIIRDAVKAATGKDVSTITFNIGTRIVGRGFGERDEVYFKGATVKFEPTQFSLKGMK